MIPCPRDNATARIASTPVLSYGLRRAYTILTQALDDGWRPRTPKAVLSSLSLSLTLSLTLIISAPFVSSWAKVLWRRNKRVVPRGNQHSCEMNWLQDGSIPRRTGSGITVGHI